MEKGLRDCCRSIRIGKILIKVNEETKMPTVNNESWLELFTPFFMLQPQWYI